MLQILIDRIICTLTEVPLRLKPIDVVVLKKLSEVVNVVPVIAKSDSLTIEEREAFRQRVCFSNFRFLWHFR